VASSPSSDLLDIGICHGALGLKVPWVNAHRLWEDYPRVREVTAAEALDHWNHLAQIFFEFCGVLDGVLAKMPDVVAVITDQTLRR
jgi:hypothetical protein